MKENEKMIKQMDMECTYIWMGQLMKETELKTFSMGMEQKNGQMAQYMKEIFFMVHYSFTRP